MVSRLSARLSASVGFLRLVRNWPAYHRASRSGPAGRRFTLLLRSGVRFTIRAGTLDAAMFKEVFVHRLYTPPGFAIAPGDAVVDIGAHVGFFSVFAARAAAGVRVLAFEPAPPNFELLRANLEQNGLANVTARPQAVSGRAGMRELRLSDNTGGHSFHVVEQRPPVSIVRVEAVTLPDVCDELGLAKIDLVKLDCEGEEHAILEQMPAERLGTIRRVAMECHDLDEERTSRRLAAFLEKGGFDVQLAPKPDRTAMLWARRR